MPPQCSSAKFDDLIKDAVNDYWRDFPDPKFWKAQLCQESHLDPKAVSPVGAQGLAQMMPATYAEVVRQLHWNSAITAFDPERAIRAGAFYQGNSRRFWSPTGRTSEQRNQLGLCGYNAGNGNCVKAQKACGTEALTWDQIGPCLQQVTGKYSTETLTYVSNITRYAAALIMGK